MGYVPPYISDQRMIYGSRDQDVYSTLKYKLEPVERAHFKNVSEKMNEMERPGRMKSDHQKPFQKILTELTGKGSNVNEIV
ncbi:hypothetical protein [Pseudalkalibacillus sp. SCS-8]|uniref:hypothetical protein n=1 Tax=Pseudalkalibacillus nanhaiensis TaxID=3115291 RepID=UPI0032DAD6F7